MIERVERHEGSAPSGWTELLHRLDGSVFHSEAWADYQRASGALQPWYLIGYDASGEASAGAVAYVRHSTRPVLRHVSRSLEIPAHPFLAVEDEPGSATMLRALEALGRSAGCASIDLHSFGSGRSALLPERFGYRETARVEFVVDLTRDTDELWRGIGKDQRERIRKLERQGLSVEVGRTRGDLEALRTTREQTRDKRVDRGQGYALAADPAFYDRLHRGVIEAGIGRLFVARSGGADVAALLFAALPWRAYSLFSGSSPEGYRLGAQSLLFWRAVEHLRAEGMTELNRGGVLAASEREDHPLHGIYRFKLRLGGRPVRCRSGFKVIRPARHALLRWIERLRRGASGPEGDE